MALAQGWMHISVNDGDKFAKAVDDAVRKQAIEGFRIKDVKYSVIQLSDFSILYSAFIVWEKYG